MNGSKVKGSNIGTAVGTYSLSVPLFIYLCIFHFEKHPRMHSSKGTANLYMSVECFSTLSKMFAFLSETTGAIVHYQHITYIRFLQISLSKPYVAGLLCTFSEPSQRVCFQPKATSSYHIFELLYSASTSYGFFRKVSLRLRPSSAMFVG